MYMFSISSVVFPYVVLLQRMLQCVVEEQGNLLS